MDARTIEWSLMLASLSLLAGACSGQVTDRSNNGHPDGKTIKSNLTNTEKKERSRKIKRAAASEGLTNAVLLAGIAESETHFAHCWSEATWACKGPYSSSCGGPVIAGSGDGPCYQEEGGLGMFQFDGGTYDETLNRNGRDILTVAGNAREAVDFAADMVVNSRYVSGVRTQQGAIEWMNGVEVGGYRHRAWIKTVTHYYNGCKPSYGCWDQRYSKYSNALRDIYSDLGGASFWDQSTADGPADNANSSGSSSSGLTTPDGASPNWDEIRNGGSIEVSWDDVGAASSYDVELEYYDGSSWNDYYTWDTDNPPFEMWPQRNDRQYRWRVQACSYSQCSGWTDWRAFAVGQTSGGPPNDSSSDDSSSDSTDDDSGASSSSSTDDGSGSSSSGSSSSSPSDDGLSAPDGVSPNWADVRNGGSLALDWDGVAEAHSYNVDMQVKTRGSWSHYYQWDTHETSFEVWPQHEHVEYRWRLQACDGSECSSWTDWRAFAVGHP